MNSSPYIFVRRCLHILSLLLVIGVFGVYAQAAEPQAVPTLLTVHVVAQDAKLIQDAVGGATVIVRDADTGETLAQGMQRGDSGSTAKIMRQAHGRGDTVYAVPGAAVYSTTLQLTHPTRIEVTAEGPFNYPQALQIASATLLMVPGQDVVGDGVVLTLHGFIVEVLSPEELTAVAAGSELTVEAQVRMMCGCPTTPGGLWDSNNYKIEAQLIRHGNVVASTALQYAGRPSTFSGKIRIPDTGANSLRVVASDNKGVNFGMDEMSFKQQ
jgi:hypothetical protein